MSSEYGSLVVQDLLLADNVACRGDRVNKAVKSICSTALSDETSTKAVVDACFDKNSSRVVERLVKFAKADKVERLYQVVLQVRLID